MKNLKLTGINWKITKYVNESCGLAFDLNIFFNHFPKTPFVIEKSPT